MKKMTKHENEFNLLKGTFSCEETREILVTLFKDKIQFHNLKNFSNEVRFGTPDIRAQERIPELKRTLEEVLDFIKQNEGEDKFEIHANIQVRVVE